MKTIKAKTIALVIAMSASTSVYAFPGYQWEKAAQSVGIDPVMLYAVALAESASHRGLNMTSPWPYAIRNGSNATYAKSKTEAEQLLNQALQESEKYQLDIGLMQINLHWHGHRVSSAAELLDPITNLTVGSSILGHVRQGGVNSVAALRLGNAPVMRSVAALLSPHQRPGLSPPCSVEAGNGSAKAIPRSAPPAPRPVAA